MTVTVTGVLGQAVYDVVALSLAWFVLRFSGRLIRMWMYARERRQRERDELKKLRADAEERWQRKYDRDRKRRRRSS